MPDRTISGVGWYFSASHRDPIRQELHGHTYEVVAWFPADPPRDALVLQQTLRSVLAVFDHTTLADCLGTAEVLAGAILASLDGCVRVTVSRPSERLYAEAWSE
jgi:6-pyruvoyl-tetrahydropterin synthase